MRLGKSVPLIDLGMDGARRSLGALFLRERRLYAVDNNSGDLLCTDSPFALT